MSEPQPYSPSIPTGTTNTPGRIALILAIVAVALAVVQQILSVFAPLLAYNAGASTAQISGVFGVVGAIHLLLSIGAVVFGAVGITRRAHGQPVIAAALGLGAGATGVIGGIVGFAVIPLVAQLI